jgi:hypothetical protein
MCSVCRNYCCKYKSIANTQGQEGWNVQWVCGGAVEDGFLDKAFEAWRLQNKNSPFVERVSVTERNLSRKTAKFKARQLSTLELHPVQVIRFMVLSDFYMLVPELASKGVLHGCRNP